MTRTEWQEIALAREVLGLGERATLGEIKRAFRKRCKIHHPDLNHIDSDQKNEAVGRLIEAQQVLLGYCEQYRFPLAPEKGEEVEPDDWWLDRFGQDPLWGKGKT